MPPQHRAAIRAALFAARAPLYRGDRFECPICDGHFRKLLPFGEITRNVQCPRCGSVERHRALWLWLQQRPDFFTRPRRLLHVAPEVALERPVRALRNIDYVSVDIGRAAMIRADITDLPFADESFDAIICICVLEHVPDDAKAMRELHRVMKPGGFGIVQVPIHVDLAETYEDWTITTPEGRRAAFEQDDHVRLYGRDYRDRLTTAGFDVTVDDFPRTRPVEMVERYSLNPDEDLYVVARH